MLVCNKCNAGVADGAKFCPECGAPIEAAAQMPQGEPQKSQQIPQGNAQAQQFQQMPQGNAQAQQFHQIPQGNGQAQRTQNSDVEQYKWAAILSYISILVLIPIFAARESKFARFHANQGLVLFLITLAWRIVQTIIDSILLTISWRLLFVTKILDLAYIGILVFAIIGIVNAANGEEKELPYIGKIKILN